MFHLCMFLFSALLFFILTPGILITIPSKSSKNVVALVHALIFSTICYFTHKLVYNANETFDTSMTPEMQMAEALKMAETIAKLESQQSQPSTPQNPPLMNSPPQPSPPQNPPLMGTTPT